MTHDADTKTFVLFRLAEEGYALPVDVVTSVIRFEEPMPVPRAPHAVMGVVNLRSRVLPVVDLKLRFGGERFSEGPRSRILVVEGPTGPTGVAVDAVLEVARFSADEIRPVPDAVLGSDTSGAFAGMVERPDGLLIVLDPDRALATNSLTSAAVTAIARKEEGSHV